MAQCLQDGAALGCCMGEAVSASAPGSTHVNAGSKLCRVCLAHPARPSRRAPVTLWWGCHASTTCAVHSAVLRQRGMPCVPVAAHLLTCAQVGGCWGVHRCPGRHVVRVSAR